MMAWLIILGIKIPKKDQLEIFSGKITIIKTATKAAPIITGGAIASKGNFLNSIFLSILVKIEQSKVENVPKMISIIPKGLDKLARKQPIVRPGMAAGVSIGSIVSTSEILNCIPTKASPKILEKYVKITYKAAITADIVILFNFLYAEIILIHLCLILLIYIKFKILFY